MKTSFYNSRNAALTSYGAGFRVWFVALVARAAGVQVKIEGMPFGVAPAPIDPSRFLGGAGLAAAPCSNEHQALGGRPTSNYSARARGIPPSPLAGAVEHLTKMVDPEATGTTR